MSRSKEDSRLFGEIVLEKKYVDTTQLYEALTIQAKLETQGRSHRFLGEILVDLGYLSEPRLLEVLTELHGSREKIC